MIFTFAQEAIIYYLPRLEFAKCSEEIHASGKNLFILDYKLKLLDIFGIRRRTELKMD